MRNYSSIYYEVSPFVSTMKLKKNKNPSTQNPQYIKNSTFIPAAVIIFGDTRAMTKQLSQFVIELIEIPFSGKISAQYSQTTGPKVYPKAKL